MKNFITSMLGALAALLVFSAGAVLLFIGLIGAIVAMIESLFACAGAGDAAIAGEAVIVSGGGVASDALP